MVPWSRGDVLAAIHREGEVVGQTDGDESATLQVVLDDVGPGPLRRVRGGTVTFRLPPYPYDRLAGLAKLADAHPGGMVDCSVGTPVRSAAAAPSSTRWRRRAPSAGTPPRPAARSCARPPPPG